MILALGVGLDTADDRASGTAILTLLVERTIPLVCGRKGVLSLFSPSATALALTRPAVALAPGAAAFVDTGAGFFLMIVDEGMGGFILILG